LATPHLAPDSQPAIALTPVTRPGSATADSILFYGTFSLLLFAPLAFGSTDPIPIFLLQLGSASLFLFWLMRQLASGSLRISWNPLFRPVLLFALLVGLQVALGATAYRYQTISHALLYTAYGCLIFLVTQTLQRTSQIKILAWTFCAYGTAIALFALLQSLSSNGKIYWLWQPQSGGWIYGPYVNHNHYAGLMEMLFPIPVVMALDSHVPRRRRWLPISAAVVIGSTIFLSGSRGGMIAFLVQAVVLGIFMALNKSRRAAFTAGAVLLVIAALMVWVGGEGVLSRISSIHSAAQTEVAGGTRLAIARDTLKMVVHKPLLGYGLGNFAVAYPAFRSFYSEKFVNHAHNDYLQALVEMGILGFAAVAWFLFLTLRGAIKKLDDWTWNINGAVALAALVGCTGILVHSLLDFNLQVPANAALFYALCAIAAADTKFGSHRRIRHRHRTADPADQPAQATSES
jgi:O-antigen ligase